MSLLDRLVRRPLRPLLLRALSWVEESPALPPARRGSWLKREIRVPSSLVGLAVWVMLFAALFQEFGPGWDKALGLLLFTGMAMALFVFYLRQEHPDLLQDEEAVALLGLLAFAGVWLIQVWARAAASAVWVSHLGAPLSAAAILAALLLHPRLAAVFAVVLSIISGLMDEFSLQTVFVSLSGALAGVAGARSARTRADVVKAGLWVASARILAVLVLALLGGWSRPLTAFSLWWALGGAALAVVLVLALLPVLESFFSRLTNIKLLELADVNHPLLKRMSLEAPGTYHHSLIMASLAQAAAEAVGANGLLCRVGAYFHDIGKMQKPEYFVENQGALGNPHDPLPPSMSRLVIQSHVKEGVALARQYGLDRAIADFITMHHGTSRIEYFYRRAIEQSGGLDEVDEDEYRYPGPRPRSRETAILMLADSTEASVRALENPTHQRIKDQIQKVIETKMADGQFEGVPLTLRDLSAISDSFLNTLIGVYHSRIRYPEAGDAEAASPPAEAGGR